MGADGCGKDLLFQKLDYQPLCELEHDAAVQKGLVTL